MSIDQSDFPDQTLGAGKRRKRGEYDPPDLEPTSSDLLREIYAMDPSDPGPDDTPRDGR